MTRFNINSFVCLIVLLCMQGSVNATNNTLTVAVASNFMPVLEHLSEAFEHEHPNANVVWVSGSSGKIYAQIKHGAPFDIFMSADQAKPTALVEEGVAIPASRFTYALGRLVLWSADSELIQDSSLLLKQNSFTNIALANAKLAPYGVAAEQVLEKLGVLTALRSKWVQGENIAQTYQFVATQNAALGFVAKSQVWRQGGLKSGSAWFVPTEFHSPIKQDAVILRATKNLDMAVQFMQCLQSNAVRQKIEGFGYDTTEYRLQTRADNMDNKE